MITEHPVFGRTGERSVIEELVAATRRGRGSVVLVSGAAGIGKSLLLDLACAGAQRSDVAVFRGAGREREQVRPFGPIIDALRPRRSEPYVERVFDLARGAGANDGSFVVHDEVLDLFERFALAQPTALVLDDLQWADAATLAVLPRLAAMAHEVPLLVALGSRPCSALGDLSVLATQHLVLPPLSGEDVAALVADRFHRLPGRRLLDLLARAGGNPLFVGEILRELERDGALVVDEEVADCAENTIPASAHTAILSRLAFLSEGALELLRTAAVLGSTFTVGDLAIVLGRAASELAPLVDEAWRAGIVVELGDSMRFQHDIVHEAIYTDVPESVRLALHRDAGRALAAAGAPAGQVAAHLSIGARQGDEVAIRWIGMAATQAAATSSAVAAALFQRLVPLLPDRDPRRPGVLLQFGFNLLASGRIHDGEVAARQALNLAPSDDERAHAERLLGRVLSITGRLRDSLANAEAAVARAQLGVTERAHVLAEEAIVTLPVDVSLAMQRAAAAQTAAIEAGNQPAEARALLGTTLGYFIRGDFAAALVSVRRCEERGRSAVARGEGAVGYLSMLARGYDGPPVEGMWALFMNDELDAAMDAGARAQAYLSAHGPRDLMPFVLNALAVIAYQCGRWDEAQVCAETAVAVMQEMGIYWQRRMACSVLARLALHRGELDLARMWMSEVDCVDGEAAVYERPWVDFTRAAVVFEASSDAGADLADDMWVTTVDDGCVGIARLVTSSYVRLAVHAGRKPDHVLEHIESMRMRSPELASLDAILGHCRGLLDGDADALLRAVRVYDTVGLLGDAMLAAADAGELLALDRRDAAIPVLQDALERAERLGAHGDAARLLSELRRLGVRRGARASRRQATVGWDALTEAERRVVELAAGGLTNRQMAERLFLSPRTVESHLAHIYRKLGVSTRAELAMQFARREDPSFNG